MLDDPSLGEAPVNEPAPSAGSRPEAFGPTPRQIEGGCLRPAAIGCGALGLFLGIALLALVWRAENLLVWTLDLMENQIVTVLPEEISDEQRQRLDEGLAGARLLLTGGQVDPESLQRLQRALIEYSNAAGRGITVNDVDRLIGALERLDPDQGELPRSRSPDRSPSEDDTELPATAANTA